MAVFPGTRDDDTYTGTSEDDLLNGAEGNDNLSARDGNDTLIGGSGIDQMRGEGGNDIYVIRAGDGAPPGSVARETIRESLSDGFDVIRFEGLDFADIRIWSHSSSVVTFGVNDGFGNYLETDVNVSRAKDGTFWDRIEALEFDGRQVVTAADALVWTGLDSSQTTFGTTSAEVIEGRGGDDSLHAGAGDDTLVGGLGADTMFGGEGDDLYLIGEFDGGYVQNVSADLILENPGEGYDIVEFADLGDGQLRMFHSLRVGGIGFVSDTVADPTQATYIIHQPDSVDLWDQIEEIHLNDGTVMTEATGLTAYGTDNDDTIYGTRANDRLNGLEGDDFIIGYGGDDVLIVSPGMDRLWGGDGIDIVFFDSATYDEVTFRKNALDDSLVDLEWAGGVTMPGRDVEIVRFLDRNLAFEDLIKHVPLTLFGTDADDRMEGFEGSDFLRPGNGADTVIGGGGDDDIVAGNDDRDLRDVVYAGPGDDTVDGGYGNDELRGGEGNDLLEGGFGADFLVGGPGDDVLTGGALSDLLFGGDGFDFLNGGFGSDRLNGGAGADRFFHLGVAGHGSDWIQDYSAAEGDVLVYGGAATVDQFQVNIAPTAGAGADGVDEVFVIHRPTGQILWALVDGDAQDEITLRLGGAEFDLFG